MNQNGSAGTALLVQQEMNFVNLRRFGIFVPEVGSPEALDDPVGMYHY